MAECGPRLILAVVWHSYQWHQTLADFYGDSVKVNNQKDSWYSPRPVHTLKWVIAVFLIAGSDIELLASLCVICIQVSPSNVTENIFKF